MTYYAIIKFDYKVPSEYFQGDFGRTEYARCRRHADKAEIVSKMYSPFPSFIAAEVVKEAFLYFKTKEKFAAFDTFVRNYEDKKGTCFNRSCTYPQKAEQVQF